MSLVIYSIGVDTHIHTQSRTHTHTHTNTHTCTNEYTHTHIHTHKHCTQIINYDVAIRIFNKMAQVGFAKFLFQFHNVAMAITSSC